MTSGALQLYPQIIDNILIVPEFICSCLNVLVLLADNRIRQTVSCIHQPISKTIS